MGPILQLEYSNGSLPSPYSYSYKISFFETGYAQLEFYAVNNEDLKEINTENRKFNLNDVHKKILQLRNNPEKRSELMIGGEIMRISFENNGKQHEIDISPNDKEQKEVFNHLVNIYDENFEQHKNDIIKNLYNN